MSRINWERIHNTTAFTALTPLLALLSFFYGLGVRFRLLAYKRAKRRSLPGFVVSIGNLTVGGTGKTPAACMLAEWARGEGYAVAILSRGYGGQYKTEVLEVSDGDHIHAGQADTGDEPYLMAKRLRGVPVVLSKKRYQAGLRAHKRFGTNFYILDDGFQHRALKRDLDLLLIDASDPFGNGHLLPWGPLREPVGQLKRTDAFIITRTGYGASINDLKVFLKNTFPDKPLFTSDHIPEGIVFPYGGKSYSPEFLRGKRVIAFAGIARPESFRKTLINLGAEVCLFKAFDDHHKFYADEIQDLISKKKGLGADYLVTTEKDWVRMENLNTHFPDLAYLTVRFELQSEGEAFFRMIKNRLERDRKPDMPTRGTWM
ncbi:MAG: tetraacyldisaccharide 4'-kinase [Pseudomonadota bacterium]